MLNKIINNMNRIIAKRDNKQVWGRKVSVHLEMPHTAALGVIRKLIKGGFEAYLVGGAVRDLLLGITPKDFDVATNATPEQVRALFPKRSRIIGKRFPIVHVLGGTETIEVSTFRSGITQQNVQGRIVKDNAYGTLEQDAVRRDFTCNALYYDIIHHQVIDFHHGMQDIKRRQLVMIGDAVARYQEDPVRILRAVRLASKLGFEIEAETAAPIADCAHLLGNEPVSRLFDELMKILFSGYAQSCLNLIHDLNIHVSVHPLLTVLQGSNQPMVQQSLQQTDRRLREGKSVSMGFILAALLWQDLNQHWQRYLASGQSSAVAMQEAIAQMREHLEMGWGVPQRYALTMREIWSLQPSFEYRRGARAVRLLGQPRFRAAYDFLLLRAAFGEVAQELADWWTRFQAADGAMRQAMIAEQQNLPVANAAAPKPKKRQRTRRRKKALAKQGHDGS